MSDDSSGARPSGALPVLNVAGTLRVPSAGTSEDSASGRPPEANEFLCARCARHMPTCCQTSEVYATPGDVSRIEAFTGQTDFCEFRLPEDPVYLLNDDDPAWREFVFRDDGTRRVVRRRENGDCTFLGERGCVLPLEVRPLICRIYPYDFNEQGFKEQLARGCPMELLAPGQDLLEALEMDEAGARRWHRQLYEEIRLEKPGARASEGTSIGAGAV